MADRNYGRIKLNKAFSKLGLSSEKDYTGEKNKRNSTKIIHENPRILKDKDADNKNNTEG